MGIHKSLIALVSRLSHSIRQWFFSLFTGKRPSTRELPDAVRRFAKLHRLVLQGLGLEAEAAGLSFTEVRVYSDRGIETELTAKAMGSYPATPQSAGEQGEDLALTKLQADLAFRTRFALGQAEAAIKALMDLVLRPNEMRWLGGETQVRSEYLNLPLKLTADRAITVARTLHKEAVAAVTRARGKALKERLRPLAPGARLDGKLLCRRYEEHMPFLAAQLTLELNIDKVLDHRDAERLILVSEAEISNAVDAVLASARQALVARVKLQLEELAHQIGPLPHIELLTDAEIAETVAPYYGGLNRALKKRRAKSALVAVEERAREAKYQDDVAKFNEHKSSYANVASYYPLARTLKRQLVLFVGPTNSGKTWRALNELALADSGVYLAPLRLLALEGQEELEKRGKPTSFITGEERDLRPDAKFISSTIEMLNVESLVGAVVVDEVQLLADERRGWAWLAAVVGAPAAKVIMTGSPDCVELVKGLAAYLGEELTICECQRHNELRVAPAPMRLREIRPGTAIVCFSRRDVLRIKTTIQENSDLEVAVVYGNLSPQVRREEARRFRTGEAPILVATDAIAMGLNLPIREVLFYTTEKFNGEELVPLTDSEIRQIAGRAGRYGFANYGVVNALTEDSLEHIREALEAPAAMLMPPYFVAPGQNHIRIISDVLGTTSLERILTFFERAVEFSDERFARSNIDDLSYLSTFVDERLAFLDVAERLTIACAPVAIRNETVLGWFLSRMLPQFKNPDDPEQELDDLDDLFGGGRRFNEGTARNQMELRDAEDCLKTLTVYAWLAYRYPTVYTRIDDCEDRRETVNAFVERSLRKVPDKSVDRPAPQRPKSRRRKAKR